MTNKFNFRLFLVLPFLLLASCSDNENLISSARDPDFYSVMMNSPEDFLVAKEKLPQLNLVQTGDDYPMRFALFTDGRFYYQIDRLGDGNGYWKFHQGGLELTAVRPIFDMHIYLSARESESDKTLVRFYDRHGFNSVNTEWIKPVVIPAASKTKSLRPYSYSEKDI